MKKLFLTISLLLHVGFMAAENQLYLTISSQGAEKSVELSTVQKITFSTSEALVHTTTQTFTFPLDELNKMSFTTEPSAIGELPQQTHGLQPSDGKLFTSGKGMLRIYNTSGTLVHMAAIQQERAVVSLDNLASGLYIISLGDQTIKLIK